MSIRTSPNALAGVRARVSLQGSTGDRVMRGLCVAGGIVVVLLLADIAFEIIKGAAPAIGKFGLPFLVHATWAPNTGVFGAAVMLYGTAVTAAIALVISVPVGIAIGIYLAMLAPALVRVIVGPVIEMLAAIPSVILGLWGLLIFAPFLLHLVEPPLHSVLGFTGVFGAAQTTGLSLFAGGVILTVMVVPIIASLSRDLFLSVPLELTEGAEALGATRWEVIRGVVLPSTFPGVLAAVMLGLGRALGEAIAVASVIGAGNLINGNWFATGNTFAARIALEIQYVVSSLHRQSLYYLALILLVIGVATNLIARLIARRYDVHRVI